MEHNYITCTGFGGTGSSMLSDLMKEFDNVKSCGSQFEMTLAFDYGGISDLEHYIVDDFERNKTSEGIYFFQKHIKNIRKIYTAFFGDIFDECTNQYVRDLVEVEWLGQCGSHIYRYGSVGRCFFYKLPIKIQHKIRKLLPRKDTYERTSFWKKKLPIQLSYCDEEKFIVATKKMTKLLLDSLDREEQFEYLCFDQLVPAYGFYRYSRYFSNIKIVIVDRDPRDLYLLNELYWKEGWIPSDNIDVYVNWYKLLRRKLNDDLKKSSNVLYIQFESTVYDYENTLNKIIDFLNLDSRHHIYKKKYFNPDLSIVNTKLWERTSSKVESIRIIEKELAEYCVKY